LISTVVLAGSNPKTQKIDSKDQGSASPVVVTSDDAALDSIKYAGSVSAVERKPGETWEQSIGVDKDFVHIMECAFLRTMTSDTLEVDPVEYIDEDTDPQRLKELGITKEYLKRMDGYELNNPEEDTILWKIDEDTEFIFADWGRDFIIEEVPCNSIMVKTKDRELFRRYLTTYKNSKPGMPFFFEVENGVVKRIVEKLFA
jgi:hypothetical protein